MKTFFSRLSRGVSRLCWFGFCLALFSLTSFPSSLYAQEFRATLTGEVTDPSSALVAKAKVTAVNVDTGQSYTAETSSAGVYYIPYVIPGIYTVTVTAEGFRTAIQENVLLVAAKYYGQNFRLELGSVAEKVMVTSAPPALETSSGSGGTLIDERIMQSVPLDGRQVYMLIGTTPGSQFLQQQFGPGGYSGTRGWDVSNNYTIGGGVQGYQQFTLDGTNVTQQTGYGNQNNGAWNIAPNIDAIQEVNVMTSTYDARYGRTGGGTVNMVTKNGTNAFHGDVFEYYEGAVMNANNVENKVTGTPRGGMVQNQFGGTFGGPIKKDKIFFFGSYEGYRESIAGSIITSVPPAYLRPQSGQGVNFNLLQQMDPQQFPQGVTIFDPSTTTCSTGSSVDSCNVNSLVRTAFPNNTIPAQRISATGAAILNLYPLPNIPSRQNFVSNNYFSSTPDLYRYDQPMVRVDYNTSDKTRWYSFFAYQPGHENRNGNGFTGIAERGNIDWTRTSWTASQDMTHTFSPTLLGDFKLSFSRFYANTPDGVFSAAQSPTAIGLNMPTVPTAARQNLPEITGVAGAGNGAGGWPSIIGNTTTQDASTNVSLDADFTKTKGAHNIHFGGMYAEYQYGNPDSVGNANGVFQFDSSTYTQFSPGSAGLYPTPNGMGLADLLLGYPNAGHVDYNLTIMEGQPVWALYGQDDWRVTHRLTVNLGLRYDVQRGLRERNNGLNRGACLTCVSPITAQINYPLVNAGLTSANTGLPVNLQVPNPILGGVLFPGVNGQPRDAYNTDWSNIQPRIGFAYSVNPKTVVRGGWGLMYAEGLEGGRSLGFYQSTNYSASLDGGRTPSNYFLSGNPYPNGVIAPTKTSLGLLTGIGDSQALDFPGRKIPRSMIASLGVQRELPFHMTLDVRLVANNASHLRVFEWVNGTQTLAAVNAHIQADIKGQPDTWSAQVPNPYCNMPNAPGACPFGNNSAFNPASGCASSTTIAAIDLQEPLGFYCSGAGGSSLVGEYNAPVGKNWYDGLEVKLNKRLYGDLRGLSFSIAYTYSKTMNQTNFRNGWPYQDPEPLHEIAGYDRTHVFTWTGVWDLPVGKGSKYLATNPPKVLGAIINDWKLNWVFSAATGFPVNISGDSGLEYTCSHWIVPDGKPTFQHYFYDNNGNPQGCWTNLGSISPWSLGYLPDQISQVRQPYIPNIDMSLQKNFPIRESWKLQFRADAFNLTNSALYGGPDTNPFDGPPVCTNGVCTGFGTVNTQSQLNFPRRLQLALKLLF